MPSTEAEPSSVQMNCSMAVVLKRLCFLPMQTQKKAPAKGTTGEEIKEIIEVVHALALEKERRRKGHFRGGVRICWDNARQHKWAERQLKYNFVKIPPYSPDFNKVVEHQFNTIKGEFQKRVLADLSICDYRSAADLLVEVVGEVVTPDELLKDASTMKATMRAVYQADGGWPPPKLA